MFGLVRMQLQRTTHADRQQTERMAKNRNEATNHREERKKEDIRKTPGSQTAQLSRNTKRLE